MDTIKLMIGTSCFVGIAISIADMMKPSEKFNKQIRMIFSLTFILSVLTPIVTNGINFSISEEIISANGVQYSEMNTTVDNQLKLITEKNIEDSLRLKLVELGIKCNKINVSINIDENSGISINKIEINSDDNEKSKKIISTLLSVEEDVIIALENEND
ncbi:MAG: hypothetical protein GX286_04205 [Clostridiales bacterium]|nr:hypothetical protein [Clostridiales bacterium]